MNFSFVQRQNLHKVIEQKLKELRPLLLKSYGQISHQAKADKSAVTELDLRVEHELIEVLSKADDSIGFYGEETGRAGNQETFWLIDPIDGTEHYIRGLPFCSNMITLIHDEQPIAAVIYDFIGDNFYEAYAGHGATRNKEPIKVAADPQPHRLHLAIEINAAIPSARQFMGELYNISPFVVDYAVSGMSYVPVAEGKLDARIGFHSWAAPWDSAPGGLLVREAGGVLQQFSKDDYTYETIDFFVGSKGTFDVLEKKGVFKLGREL